MRKRVIEVRSAEIDAMVDVNDCTTDVWISKIQRALGKTF